MITSGERHATGVARRLGPSLPEIAGSFQGATSPRLGCNPYPLLGQATIERIGKQFAGERGNVLFGKYFPRQLEDYRQATHSSATCAAWDHSGARTGEDPTKEPSPEATTQVMERRATRLAHRQVRASTAPLSACPHAEHTNPTSRSHQAPDKSFSAG